MSFVSVVSLVTADCPQISETYELKLRDDDADLVKLIQNGWNLVVSKGKNFGASEFSKFWVDHARVQVVGNERRYTILVQFKTYPMITFDIFCYLFVWTGHKDSTFIDCWPGFIRVSIIINFTFSTTLHDS